MKQNWIGGAWVDGATVTRNINPSDLSDLVGEYAQADRQGGFGQPVWSGHRALEGGR
jgi:hypothetical protein